jgi:ankyrin repeat protein
MIALASMGDQELFDYIKPDLPTSDQNKPTESEDIQKQLNGIKFQLKKVNAMLDDVVNHDKFGDKFTQNASDIVGCGLTLKEIMSLTYYSLNDKDKLVNPDKLRSAEINFIRKMYEIRRGYNIDFGEDNPDLHIYNEQTPDQNICSGGTVNKCVDSLNGIHKDVEIKVITENTVKQAITVKLYEEIQKNADKFGENFAINLFLWKNNKKLPNELKRQIEDLLAPTINEQITAEYKDFFNPNQIIIYTQEVINDLKLLKKLERHAAESITNINKDRLAELCIKGELPAFMLSDKGYITSLEFVSDRIGGFETLLDQIDTKEKLKSLLGKDYTFTISNVDPKIRGLLLGKCFDLDAINELKDERGNLLTYAFAAITDKYNLDLMITLGADINTRDYIGQTALMKAAGAGNTEAVKLLIEKGANLDVKINNDPILIWSIKNNKTDITIALLKKGGDVNAKDNVGWTPLHYAAPHSHVAIVKLLIEKGADINAKDNAGWTPLHAAAKNGKTEAVKLLIEKGANLETRDNFNRTALMLALLNGNTEAIKLLIDAKDNTGYTALMHAAREGKTEAMQLLIEKGADISAKANDGNTALMTAVIYNYPKVVKLLIENGADVNAKDKSGKTAYDYAKTYKIKELIESYQKEIENTKSKLNTKLKERIDAALQDFTKEKNPTVEQTTNIIKKHKLTNLIDSKEIEQFGKLFKEKSVGFEKTKINMFKDVLQLLTIGSRIKDFDITDIAERIKGTASYQKRISYKAKKEIDKKDNPPRGR